MAWKETYTTKDGEKRYRVGSRDALGRKHSKTFVRSKDAEAYMLEVTRKEQLGHLWQDAPETFGAFAGLHITPKNYATGKDYVRLTGDGWFSRYEATVRKSTFDRRKHVIAHLRELLPIRLDHLTPALVHDTILNVQKTHPRQARILHDTVQMIVRAAAVRGQVVQPGLLTLTPPAHSRKRAPRALSQDEIERLALASSEPHLIRVAAYTGLRQGELFALRDQDIDLEAGTITVCGSVYEGTRYEHTKTSSGLRTVNIAPQVVTELKRQLLRRKAGVEIVFPTMHGQHMRLSHFNAKFQKAARDADLDVTFHELRHTFASLMVEAGVHPKVLQELMGHSSFNTTMTLYAHLKDDQRKDAAVQLGNLLGGGAGVAP